MPLYPVNAADVEVDDDELMEAEKGVLGTYYKDETSYSSTVWRDLDGTLRAGWGHVLTAEERKVTFALKRALADHRVGFCDALARAHTYLYRHKHKHHGGDVSSVLVRDSPPPPWGPSAHFYWGGSRV